MKTLKNIFAIIVITTAVASCTPTSSIEEDNTSEHTLTDGNSGGGIDDSKD